MKPKEDKKYLFYIFIIAAIIAIVHTMSYEEELAAESFDPSPYMNDGLGCITDSECEGVERGADNLPLSVNE